jgi:hypothetical protein
VNEIQIIQRQLATEGAHFAEITQLCAAAIESGRFAPGSEFAGACSEYFAFAVKRISGSPTSPDARAPLERWRDFFPAFKAATQQYFAPVEQMKGLPVAEWRARFPVDADSMVTERSRYDRVKATVP